MMTNDVKVSVEVTILEEHVVSVNEEDPQWIEKAIKLAEHLAFVGNDNVISMRSEVVDG